MTSLLKKYYYSILKPDEFSKATEFLSERKNDRLVSQAMKALWDEEMQKPEVELRSNPNLLSKIQEIIVREKHQASLRKLKAYTWGLRVAAVLVAALLLSNIFFFHQSDKGLAEQLQTIYTPYGAKTNYTLPDGSVVWLNAGSSFSYPVQFGKIRTVNLVGEAFFEVVKSSKPFIVNTEYGEVKVKGTSFNVKAYTDDDNFETTLVEGVVAFSVKNSTREVTLKPGEQIEKTGLGFEIKPVETKYFTSWKDGKLLFNREPFPDFIKRLERWYNVKIDFADPKLNELWYTGTIEMESISEVMELISKAAPVSYSFDNKTRIFTIKSIEQ
ncbi:FecR domain-containing protein [Maribellus sp. YY47]|uniref:FecR family protein n=1 Tax=Maribellus sp. YY47 TaxID=2929486 RepID=UPI00200158F8|nr:FecR domain-containing protein [Maribellus sp. YY47]MCK3685600.1 FecR family protein [Maribellus sp. YY47]